MVGMEVDVSQLPTARVVAQMSARVIMEEREWSTSRGASVQVSGGAVSCFVVTSKRARASIAISSLTDEERRFQF